MSNKDATARVDTQLKPPIAAPLPAAPVYEHDVVLVKKR